MSVSEHKWEKDGSSAEIRTQGELPDGPPALDEVLAERASIHLEQMSHDQWWMSVDTAGKNFHLWFVLKTEGYRFVFQIRVITAGSGKEKVGKSKGKVERVARAMMPRYPAGCKKGISILDSPAVWA
jgi:hypothetical protein